jgi:hypothetical protein
MATFTVLNTNDSGAGSLRQAVADADALAGADTVVFQAGLTGTITLASSISVTDDLAIAGPGAGVLAVSGADASRIFFIAGAGLTVSINDLTLTRGRSTFGGAIYNSGTLTLNRVAVTDSNGGGLSGGGVYSSGALTVRNSSFSGNASGSGSALFNAGALTVSNSTFYGNTAANAAISSNASSTLLVIENSTFVGNTGTLGGNAAVLSTQIAPTITNSIFAGNVVAANFGVVLSSLVPATLSYSLVQGPTSNFTYGAGVVSGAAADAYSPGAATVVDGLGVFTPPNPSAVLNAGDPGYTPGPTVDQLGHARVFGGRIDMGAVELQAAAILAVPPAASPPPSAAPTVGANFTGLSRFPAPSAVNPLPATVTTPTGQVLPNPLLEQQKAVAALIARVDAGQITLRQAQDQIVDLVDATTSVATMSYQFFTGRLPTKTGLDYLVSSPQNPADLNDGYYAGMSLENRYINFAVNLGKLGEGSAAFQAGYGALTLEGAAAKAYGEIFGAPPPGKIDAILTPERVAYFNVLGGDALGAKAALVGWLLAESAKSDLGPYAARNENFLYDLLDGTAALGADAQIYQNAGPRTVGLIGAGSADLHA